MRAITKQAIIAFIKGETFRKDNTRTDSNGLYLHNNLIAERRKDGIYISSAGWQTNTTKERLNGLGAGIYQRKGVWYWKDGEEFPLNEFVKIDKQGTV